MKIIFFDGLCPMCHGWVRRILRLDRKKIFRFAPLEGKLAEQLLPGILPGYREENTLVYLDGDRVYIRSTAVIKMALALGFPYCMGGIGWLVPKPVRDALYDAVARRRYRYGQRYASCPLPPEEYQDRFLDL